MPIYEYQCEKCQHEFEKEQRISDPPVKTCPVCKSRKVKKLISRTSFVLKGGGWYSDLYSSAKGGASSGGDDKPAPDAASASAKSETKSEKSEKSENWKRRASKEIHPQVLPGMILPASPKRLVISSTRRTLFASGSGPSESCR